MIKLEFETADRREAHKIVDQIEKTFGAGDVRKSVVLTFWTESPDCSLPPVTLPISKLWLIASGHKEQLVTLIERSLARTTFTYSNFIEVGSAR